MRTERKRSGAEPRAGIPTYCDKKEHPLSYTAMSIRGIAFVSSAEPSVEEDWYPQGDKLEHS